MTYYYILLGSFGGSAPVVVGLYQDWERMLEDIEDRDGQSHLSDDLIEDYPERFALARLVDESTIRRSEVYHRELWDASSDPKWASKDGGRPKGWDDLKP